MHYYCFHFRFPRFPNTTHLAIPGRGLCRAGVRDAKTEKSQERPRPVDTYSKLVFDRKDDGWVERKTF